MTVKTLLALLLLGAACAQAQTPEIAPVDPVDSKSSTSSVTAEAVAGAYRGDLQLGNRTVRYALDLDAHNRFVRREEVLDDAGKVQDRYDAAGAYVISQDGLRLVLIDQYGGQHVFERIVNEEWRPFDLEGMTRSAQGRIYRKDGAAPTSAEVRLRAEVLREGKAMRARDCASGMELPLGSAAGVPSTKANAQLVALQGTLAVGKNGVELRKPKTLASQDDACADKSGGAALGQIYWKLTQIDKTVVKVPAGQREPHLRFIPDTGRFLGQGICNRLSGSFDIVGDIIRLRQIDKLTSPCPPDGLSDQTIFAALTSANRLSMQGDVLEFKDAKGRVRVRLEAVR